MTRRRWVFLGLAAALAVGLGVWFLWPAPSPFRAYEQIRLGMTRKEVEAAVGMPSEHPDAVTPIPPKRRRIAIVVREIGMDAVKIDMNKGDCWTWPGYGLQVGYDQNERVIGYYLLETVGRPPSFFDRVRGWLGL